jgi:hypothetical protein
LIDKRSLVTVKINGFRLMSPIKNLVYYHTKPEGNKRLKLYSPLRYPKTNAFFILGVDPFSLSKMKN